MRGQRWRFMRVIAMCVVGGLVWGSTMLGAKAAISKITKSRASSSAAGGTEGSSASDRKLAALEKKLDEVLANQQTILQKFDAIMEELRIIKVRATLRTSS